MGILTQNSTACALRNGRVRGERSRRNDRKMDGGEKRRGERKRDRNIVGVYR